MNNHSQKKTKRNFPEFPPQEPKFIEQIHNKNETISETEFQSLKELSIFFFQDSFSNYIYQINFSKNSNLKILDSFSLCVGITNYTKYRSHLYSITLPPSLVDISSCAFAGCHFLTQITFLKNDDNQCFLKTIGDKAFLDTAIKSIKIPSSIRLIGINCFPPTLQEIEFEEGAPNLKRVGNLAFKDTKLEAIKIPIKANAFCHATNVFFKCKKLKEITFDHYVDLEGQFDFKDDEKELLFSSSEEEYNEKLTNKLDSNFENKKENEICDLKKDDEKSKLVYEFEEDSNDKKIDENNINEGMSAVQCEFQNDEITKSDEEAKKETIKSENEPKKQIEKKEKESPFNDYDDYYSDNNDKQKENQINDFDLNHSDKQKENLINDDYYSDHSGKRFESLINDNDLNHSDKQKEEQINDDYYSENSDKQFESLINDNDLNHCDKQFQSLINDTDFNHDDKQTEDLINDYDFDYDFNHSDKIKEDQINDYDSNHSDKQKEDLINDYDFDYDFNHSDKIKEDTINDYDSNHSDKQKEDQINDYDFNHSYSDELKQEKHILFNDHTIHAAYQISEVIRKMHKIHDTDHSHNEEEDIEDLNLPQTKDMATSYLLCQTKIEKLAVFITNLDFFYFFNTPNLIEITIPETEKGRYVKQNGCLYTKDLSKLIVVERNIKEAVISSKCQIISNFALNSKSLEKVEFEPNPQLFEISLFAFSESLINSIKIPDSVEIIGYGAFFKCNRLKTVNIPQSLKKIDYATFSNTSLTKIQIPQNIESIKYASFYRCTKLESVLFDDNIENLTEIGDFAFAFTSISSIKIPSSVKKIGNYCFINCQNLEKIDFCFDSKLEKIGYKCFYGSKIDSISIPENVTKYDFSHTEISSISFSQFSKLKHIDNFFVSKVKNVVIPSSVKEISKKAFLDCAQLETVEIIDSKNSKLTDICDFAFSGCINMKKFDIPETVYFIGSSSFENCISYNHSLVLKNDNMIYISEKAFVNSAIQNLNIYCDILVICECAFGSCSRLNYISINSSSICSLNDLAFDNCSSLSSVEIADGSILLLHPRNFTDSLLNSFIAPKSLQEIPNSCFENCKKLTTVTFPEDSEIIIFGERAFYNSGIKSITFPKSTHLIKERCFQNCFNLKEVSFSSEINNCYIGEKAFCNSGIINLTLPKGIKKVQNGCFKKCKDLQIVDLSDCPFMNIKSKTFKSSGVILVTLSPSINFLEKSAFQDCQRLQKVIFLCFNVTISPLAFTNCTKLQRVKINSKITIKINNSEFFIEVNKKIDKEMIDTFLIEESPRIQSFQLFDFNYSFFTDTNANLQNVVIADNKYPWEIVGVSRNLKIPIYNHINGCYYKYNKKKLKYYDFNIKSLIIPKETEKIESNAFKYSNLEEIKFENQSQLQKIPKNSFESLQIKELSIPDSVILIDDYAFYDCRHLKKVTINKTSKLNRIGKGAFQNTAIESILFPSSLSIVDDFAFYKCSELITVDNYSDKIKFGEKSFSFSSIQNINFPSKSFFCKSSFKGCLKLKQLKFIKNPQKLIFGEESFAFSGIEEIKIKCKIDIHNHAFIYCLSLKKVFLNGQNIKCEGDAFLYSNIETFLMSSNILPMIQSSIENLYLKKLSINSTISWNDYLNNEIQSSLNLSISDEFPTQTVEIFLNHKCYVINQKLKEVELIDNYSLFEKPKEKEDLNTIKNNEILQVPSKATSLDFQISSHIKKINWGTNCSISDLGSPGFFSYYNLIEITIPKLVTIIPPYCFSHCHYLATLRFDMNSSLTEIGEFAFAHTKIQKVDLPKTVTVIRKSAFFDNLNLKEINFYGEIIEDEAFAETGLVKFILHNNTKIIGKNAFQYCRSLKSFRIDPKNSQLTEIGSYAFSETSIRGIHIPSNVQSIESYTFCGCKFLTEVRISNGSKLEKIDEYSFAENLSLVKINIPKTIKYLSTKAFINTPSLQSIMSESNDKFIVQEDNVVYDINYNDGTSLRFVPRNIEQITIKEKVEVINSGAFCGPNLKTVVFSDNSLVKIEEYGFAHSTRLNEIKIPNSVLSIGEDAFNSCRRLQKVEFEETCKLMNIPKFCFAFSGLKSIIIPSSIEIIDHSSFLFCRNLKSVDLSNSRVRYIGEYAFSETKIEQIKFPSTLNFIAGHAFDGNKDLKLVDLTNLSNIEEFKQIPYNYIRLLKPKNPCSHSSSEYLITNFQFIYNNSFVTWLNDRGRSLNTNEIFSNRRRYNDKFKARSWPHYSTFKYKRAKKLTRIDKCSIYFKVVNALLQIFFKNKSNEEKLIDTCYINYFAFANCFIDTFKFKCKEYQWFNFFDSCLNIKKIALNHNIHLFLRKLKTENMNDNSISGPFYQIKKISTRNPNVLPLTYIHSNMKNKQILSPFILDCSKLTHVTLGNDIKIKSIPKFVFAYSPLKEITIPSTVQIIENYAFGYCHDLEKVTISNDSKLTDIQLGAFYECRKLDSFNFPGFLEIIGKRSFSFTSLESIEIPSSTKEIQYLAFFECKKLNKIILNEGIVEIGDSSFGNNISLINIDLPDSLTTIKSYAFSNCINLKKVNTTPKTNLINIFKGAFINTKIEELSLNQEAKILFDPTNVPKLNKITFYEGKPLHFIQTENGTIYEKTNKFDACKYYVSGVDLNEEISRQLMNDFILSNNYNHDHKSFKSNCTETHYAEVAKEFLLHGEQNVLNLVFAPKNLECLEILDNCFSINNSVLQDMNKLTSIEYKKGSTSIICSFIKAKPCNNIKTIKILGRQSFMDPNVFSNFESLEFVEFDQSTNLAFVSKHAFSDCKNLKKVILPLTCFSIEEGAFKNCTSLKQIQFINSKCSENDLISTSKLQFIKKEAFYNCSSLESIIIPPTVFAICQCAFMNCSNLKKFEFGFEYLDSQNQFSLISVSPDNQWLEVIEKNAFKNCKSLELFHLPVTCVYLGAAAFMNCISLKKFVYEGIMLQSIPCRLFFNCSSLEKFEIRNLPFISNSEDECQRRMLLEVDENSNYYQFSIGSESFMNCSSLKEIIIEDESKNIDTIQLDHNNCPLIKYRSNNRNFDSNSNNFQIIQKKAFCNCKSLINARFFLGNLERISENAFSNCTSIKNIDINTQYSKALFGEKFNSNAYEETPNDLVINLFSNNIIVKKQYLIK